MTSAFPAIWKITCISIIPKVLNPSQLKDYRPVPILPIIFRIYEKLILQQMTEFIEKQLIYHKYQSGYRKNHSATTLLMKLYDNIKTSMNKSEITSTIFLDYSKAFDSINFYTLIQKKSFIQILQRRFILDNGSFNFSTAFCTNWRIFFFSFNITLRYRIIVQCEYFFFSAKFPLYTTLIRYCTIIFFRRNFSPVRLSCTVRLFILNIFSKLSH